MKLEKGLDGYIVATCACLPGCVSQGRTREEALSNTKEAIDLYLDDSMRTGRVVKVFLPRPKDLILRKERVVMLRLDDSTILGLKAAADRKGLGVSTLVRMWVRERLEGCRP